MNRLILLCISLIVSAATMAQSGVQRVTGLTLQEGPATTMPAAELTPAHRAPTLPLLKSYDDIELTYVPTSSYEPVGGGIANYYFVATSVQSRFDSSDGTLMMNGAGHALLIDFYNTESDPIQLAPGTYTPSTSNAPFTYDPEYTDFQFIDMNGTVTHYTVTGDITVTYNEKTGLYGVKLEDPIFHIRTATAMRYYRVSYTGDMGFRGVHSENQFYPAITRNVDETFTGALGIYRGDEMESKTGLMWLYVYTAAYDPETGALTEPGLLVRMFLFNRLFGDPKQAVPVPGTYAVARNFKKDTFFPGMEINYMGATIPYGSMVYETDGNDINDKVAYVTGGTYTIATDDETGDYILTLDLVTSLGYHIRGTYTGGIPVIDAHVEHSKVVLSTLEEDLEMDLSRIRTMNVQRNLYTADRYAGTSYVSASTVYVSDEAALRGLTHYTVDLGYGADAEVIGKDEEGNTLYGKSGGDLMRLEFLADETDPGFLDREYTLMDVPPSYNPDYYAAGKALQGYFIPGGEMSGTRWAHNAPNEYADRYWHWDGHAPAVDGKFSIKYNGDDTYTVKIAVIDDGGFEITGEWTGPANFTWDINAAGIDTVLSPEASRNAIYDLQGRRLNSLRNGIILQNGRKVIR